MTDPTLQRLDRALESESNGKPSRSYIGASSIGDPCSRKLWYRLHRPAEQFEAATLRRFIDGHRTEDLVISWLRKVPGVQIWDRDYFGNQLGFEDENFHGHLDRSSGKRDSSYLVSGSIWLGVNILSYSRCWT